VVAVDAVMKRPPDADRERVQQSRDAAIFLPARRRRHGWIAVAATAVAAAAWFAVASLPISSTGLKFAVLTLVLGIAGRYAYVKVSPSSGDLALASGWVFVLALAFAFALEPAKSFVTKPDLDSGATLARSYGVVAPGQDVTAVDRCVARQLKNEETAPVPAADGLGAADRRVLYRQACTRAQAESLLLVSGIVIDRARFGQIEKLARERM